MSLCWTVLPEVVDPIAIMRQAWEHRLTACNAALFEHGPFVYLCPFGQLRQWLSAKVIQDLPGEWQVCFRLEAEEEVHLAKTTTKAVLRDVLLRFIAAPSSLLEQCKIKCHLCERPLAASVQELNAIHDHWQLLMCGHHVGDFSFRLHPQSVPQVNTTSSGISPTLEVGQAEEAIIELPVPDKFIDFCDVGYFGSLLQCIKAAGLDHDQVGLMLHIVHHQLPGAVSCLTSVPQVEHLLPLLRQHLVAGESLAITSTFEACHPKANASRFVHIFKPSDDPLQIAVAVVLPGHLSVVHVSLHSEPNRLPTFTVGSHLYSVHQINGIPAVQHTGPLQNGTLLHLARSDQIRVGGHHLASGATPTLDAGADFQARTEYMCITHGWIAADELWSITQNIMFMQDQARFTAPVYWNHRDGEFTLSPFGEIVLFNNTINVICVLIDDHWAAIEIHRRGDSAHLTFVQMPIHLHTAATLVIARLLDFTPHRLTTSSVHDQHLPRLCGWRLVQRCVMWFDIDDQFQDEAFHGVADHYRDIINLTLECSLEDWRTYTWHFLH